MPQPTGQSADFAPRLIRLYDNQLPDILLTLDSLNGNHSCYGCEKQGQTKPVEKPTLALTSYRHFVYTVDLQGGPIVKLRLLCTNCAKKPGFATVLGRVIGA